MELGIEIYYAGQWHEAAVLELLQTDQGRQSAVRLMYQQDYALNWMFRDDQHACSLNLPVELMLNHTSNRWFGFLDDIAPSGASRRFWVNRLGISHLSQGSQDSMLLEKCTIAPVGIIRTMKWGVPFEQGGEFNWHAITEQLAPIATPSQLMDDLRTLASQLVGLKERLQIRGVSETLLTMPTTGMTSIEQRLKRWGLI